MDALSKPEGEDSANDSSLGIEDPQNMIGTADDNTPQTGISPGTVASFSKERSPSPGIARRVLTESTEEPTEAVSAPQSEASTDAAIDNLTEKLANSLLEKPNSQPQKQQYVSINQKLAEKRQQEMKEQLAKKQTLINADLVAIHTSASITQLSQDDIDIAAPTENGSLNGHINGPNISSDILMPQALSDNVMDASILNISKPSTLNPSTAPSNQTIFDVTNGIDSLTPASESSGAHEVDILTAMSGEPTPNSLPLVTDGISDGEISSDSDEEGEVDLSAGLGQNHRVCFCLFECSLPSDHLAFHSMMIR